MKNNLCDKKIIESDNVHDLHCELAWLTQVHFIYLIKYFFIDFVL